MRVSLTWLKEFVDFSLTPKETADALTMAGLEVEDIVPNSWDANDSILEIGVAPNRPDCLGITGVAREISAVLNLSLKSISVSAKEESEAGPQIEIKDSALCSRYTSRVIYGVKIKPSPSWISKRLESHGFRPTNNIVDIINYVLLEMGHPLHAFDLDKLAGNRIVVKTAGSANEFLTLDNVKRTLRKDMLLIWDAEKPVAIAGVMGGLDTEVTSSTVNLLLESAYFAPLSVRKTSKALNLTSESSYRFERGMDINGLVSALDRATQLIIEIAGGKTTRITDIYPKPFSTHRIPVKFKKINDILGVKIKPTAVQEMLTRLGIENKREGEGLTVMPPSFRQDIHRDIDVIEEVARLYGYDKIPVSLPEARMDPVIENTRWNFIKTIKGSMIKTGYSEAINYSFLNPLVLDKLRLPADDRRRNLIKIRNPLRKEEEALRTTLIPALLENVRLNINRGEKSLRFFEIASVFSPSGQKLPVEKVELAVVYLKEKRTFLWDAKHDSFYDLKGVIENLFLMLGIKNYSFVQESSLSQPYLHPGKSCVIKIDNQMVGWAGTLHPDVAQDFNVIPEINIAELDTGRLLSFMPSKITYRPLPRYPYIKRDIAVTVSEDVTASSIENVILSINSDMIESVKLFDIYSGKSIPKGKKSLAFSIRYRAGDRTLVDEEVNKLHSRILKCLEASLKAELRS